MTINQQIGANIARLRKKRGWAQTALGDELGMAAGGLSKIEAGIYMPSVQVLAQIRTVLAASWNDIFRGI